MTHHLLAAESFSVSMFSEQGVCYLRLSGDIDIDSVAGLAEAVSQLHRRAPQQVYIDLGAVTFGCSTLVNFVARVVCALPSTSLVVLCRPSPETARLIRFASTDAIAEVRPDLPAPWPDFGLTTRGSGGVEEPLRCLGMAIVDVDGTYLGVVTQVRWDRRGRFLTIEGECRFRDLHWRIPAAFVAWVVDDAVRLRASARELVRCRPVDRRVPRAGGHQQQASDPVGRDLRVTHGEHVKEVDQFQLVDPGAGNLD